MVYVVHDFTCLLLHPNIRRSVHMMAENSSVDTDNDSIECFQNYTASEVFIQGLAGLVDQQDVESMIRAQKQMYYS